ncbi:MAG: NAD(P)-dependent oxidoreductase, partial [Hyphomicrobiales bacterium]|nr:NAD(P)-dependent oxidoreductase [Hyphomicrobiales bacterium]
GYLSTVGVYGNHDGSWIAENAALNTTKKRGRRRVEAEQTWLDFGAKTGMAVQIFRLAGIYGPGRSAIDKLKSGQARRIVKPGQVFNRIHVVDIATTLEASIDHPNPGAVYNVCDDEPAPPQDLVTFAAGLLNVEPPPEVAFDIADLTPMARSFYGENKRISNARIKDELGVTLAFPSYRDGLRAIMERPDSEEPVESGS